MKSRVAEPGPEELKLTSLPDSVVDSDPVGSETFSRIRIRKEFQYLTSGKLDKNHNLKVQIPSQGKNSLKRLYLVIICNLTHLQDGNTKIKFMFKNIRKNSCRTRNQTEKYR